MIPPREQDKMTVTTSSVEGFLTDSPTLILPKIGRDLTREALIEQHQMISGNLVSAAPNIGGGRHRHITLTMTMEDYMAQTS